MNNTWKVLSGSAFSAVLLAGTISAASVSAAPLSAPGGEKHPVDAPRHTAAAPSVTAPENPPAPTTPSDSETLLRKAGMIQSIDGNQITLYEPAPPHPKAHSHTSKPQPPVKPDDGMPAPTASADTYSTTKPDKHTVGQDTYSMGPRYSGATFTFKVTDSTRIVSITHDPAVGKTKQKIALSDLKPGERIAVLLKGNSKVAAKIERHLAPPAAVKPHAKETTDPAKKAKHAVKPPIEHKQPAPAAEPKDPAAQPALPEPKTSTTSV
ncbi:hypothetical protein AR543_20640 [Paenibacillus bovis]|uniref:DUF5666 domain-containing protein n=2 Tax=Paenibacillus bovis TaxID=1616788 RepID=A0A172ZM32_9BACL|nr:hypothetical protein AR543_20640 [Paenibacillus bovis]